MRKMSSGEYGGAQTVVETADFDLEKEVKGLDFHNAGSYLEKCDNPEYKNRISAIENFNRADPAVLEACENFNNEGLSEAEKKFLLYTQDEIMKQAGASEAQRAGQLAHLNYVYNSAKNLEERGIKVDAVTKLAILIHDAAKFTSQYSMGGEQILPRRVLK